MNRWIIALLFILSETARTQSFTNLNFEAPPSQPWPPPLRADRLLPGWTPFLDPRYPGFGFPYVLLDDYCVGSPCISLLSRASLPALQGRLMVSLDGGGGGPGGFGEMGLRQMGMVPSSARSLRFKARPMGLIGGTLVVRLAGRELTLIPVEILTRYTTFAADISFASGTVSELSLAVLIDFSHGIQTWTYLDDVEFSPRPATPPSAPPSISLVHSLFDSEIRFNGTLEISGRADGPFTEYPGAVSPYRVGWGGESRFFRAKAYPFPSELVSD